MRGVSRNAEGMFLLPLVSAEAVKWSNLKVKLSYEDSDGENDMLLHYFLEVNLENYQSVHNMKLFF